MEEKHTIMRKRQGDLGDEIIIMKITPESKSSVKGTNELESFLNQLEREILAIIWY